MTNPSAIATIPTNRAIIPFMRQLMGADSLGIAMIGGTLHWMAPPVQQGSGKVSQRLAIYSKMLKKSLFSCAQPFDDRFGWIGDDFGQGRMVVRHAHQVRRRAVIIHDRD